MSDGLSRSPRSGWLPYFVFIVALVLCISSNTQPWYSPEDAQRLKELREIAKRQDGQTLKQFLNANPGWKDIVAFAHPPVEHEVLDALSLFGSPASVLAMVIAGFVILRRFDKSNVREQAPALVFLFDPIDEPTPAACTMKCAYCGGAISTELVPGAPMSCPHCGAALEAPSA